MAHIIHNTVDILVRFKIDVPFIVTDDTAKESVEASAKLIKAKLSDALSALKEHYDITVMSDDIY